VSKASHHRGMLKLVWLVCKQIRTELITLTLTPWCGHTIKCVQNVQACSLINVFNMYNIVQL
jgi:hypothetical protein